MQRGKVEVYEGDAKKSKEIGVSNLYFDKYK